MPSDNRVPVTVRLTPQGLAEIDRMADDEERDRSSMIRLLLREAVQARAARASAIAWNRQHVGDGTVTRKEQV